MPRGIVQHRLQRIVDRVPILGPHPVAVAPDDVRRIARLRHRVEFGAVAQILPGQHFGDRGPRRVGRDQGDLREQAPRVAAVAQQAVGGGQRELIGHGDPVERLPAIAQVGRGQDSLEPHRRRLGPGTDDGGHHGRSAEPGIGGVMEQRAAPAGDGRLIARLVIDPQPVGQCRMRQPALSAMRRRRQEPRCHGQSAILQHLLSLAQPGQMRVGKEGRVKAGATIAFQKDHQNVAIDQRQRILQPGQRVLARLFVELAQLCHGACRQLRAVDGIGGRRGRHYRQQCDPRDRGCQTGDPHPGGARALAHQHAHRPPCARNDKQRGQKCGQNRTRRLPGAQAAGDQPDGCIDQGQVRDRIEPAAQAFQHCQVRDLQHGDQRQGQGRRHAQQPPRDRPARGQRQQDQHRQFRRRACQRGPGQLIGMRGQRQQDVQQQDGGKDRQGPGGHRWPRNHSTSRPKDQISAAAAIRARVIARSSDRTGT